MHFQNLDCSLLLLPPLTYIHFLYEANNYVIWCLKIVYYMTPYKGIIVFDL